MNGFEKKVKVQPVFIFQSSSECCWFNTNLIDIDNQVSQSCPYIQVHEQMARDYEAVTLGIKSTL